MAKKAFDPKAKERRQKKIAIGGAVLLVALLAFQGPRTWKRLNEKPPPPPVPASALPSTGGPVPLAPPTLAGAGAAASPASPASPDGLADSDPAPTPAAGQLVSFGRFESKDPFDQQLSTAAPASPSDGDTTPPSGAGAAPPAGAPPAAETPPTAPTSATISVNGVSEVVAVSAEFPQAEPMFQLVSLTESSAEIAIVGGSYANGAKTVTLTEGKPLTLMNTADGTRYELRLISVA